MDPLKNKNKTLTHGGASMHTRHDRDIIYDDVTILYIRSVLRIMALVESRIYPGSLTFLSLLCNYPFIICEFPDL